MAEHDNQTYVLTPERWPYDAIREEPYLITVITERLSEGAVGEFLYSALDLIADETTSYDLQNHNYAFLAGGCVAAEAFLFSEAEDTMKLETVSNLRLRNMPFFDCENSFRDFLNRLSTLTHQGHVKHPEFKPFQYEITDFFSNPTISYTLNQSAQIGAGFMLYQLDASWESVIDKEYQKIVWEDPR